MIVAESNVEYPGNLYFIRRIFVTAIIGPRTTPNKKIGSARNQILPHHTDEVRLATHSLGGSRTI